jgi:hypothetical protein
LRGFRAGDIGAEAGQREREKKERERREGERERRKREREERGERERVLPGRKETLLLNGYFPHPHSVSSEVPTKVQLHHQPQVCP